jgi:hypothetical protein
MAETEGPKSGWVGLLIASLAWSAFFGPSRSCTSSLSYPPKPAVRSQATNHMITSLMWSLRDSDAGGTL